mmetsp:Transcript_84756/g.248438  ORF Transcript_84756/g.248438 Transcript_84756/m.248438 type:complete len:212 (-) Transcript_84756:104-739(-)
MDKAVRGFNGDPLRTTAATLRSYNSKQSAAKNFQSTGVAALAVSPSERACKFAKSSSAMVPGFCSQSRWSPAGIAKRLAPAPLKSEAASRLFTFILPWHKEGPWHAARSASSLSSGSIRASATIYLAHCAWVWLSSSTASASSSRAAPFSCPASPLELSSKSCSCKWRSKVTCARSARWRSSSPASCSASSNKVRQRCISAWWERARSTSA